jgi:hypothetical protein
MLSQRLVKSIAIGATALAIGGGAYGVVSATGSDVSTASTAATVPTSVQPASRSGGSNARSGPAAGGTVGIVDRVSASSFTVTTATGQQVTVTKASTKTSVNEGANVLVLGTVDGTAITAGKVVVLATGGSAKSSAAGVVPFQHGSPSAAKQVGQIPANYSQGSGTIVSGTAANKAAEAALTAYPGGIVDRVVALSNAGYEVHNIGVNWPHHIFVNPNFKVVGAD